MDSTIAYRCDKKIPIDAWLALFRESGYNRKWEGERNATAAIEYAWGVVTAWDGEKAVGTVTIYPMASTPRSSTMWLCIRTTGAGGLVRL